MGMANFLFLVNISIKENIVIIENMGLDKRKISVDLLVMLGISMTIRRKGMGS